MTTSWKQAEGIYSRGYVASCCKMRDHIWMLWGRSFRCLLLWLTTRGRDSQRNSPEQRLKHIYIYAFTGWIWLFEVGHLTVKPSLPKNPHSFQHLRRRCGHAQNWFSSMGRRNVANRKGNMLIDDIPSRDLSNLMNLLWFCNFYWKNEATITRHITNYTVPTSTWTVGHATGVEHFRFVFHNRCRYIAIIGLTPEASLPPAEAPSLPLFSKETKGSCCYRCDRKGEQPKQLNREWNSEEHCKLRQDEQKQTFPPFLLLTVLDGRLLFFSNKKRRLSIGC